MSKLMLTIAASTVAALSAPGAVLAQTSAVPSAPAAASGSPGATAYQGTVGDWALGRWTGSRYVDASYTRMTTDERVLVVAKLPDGKVGCQWGTSAEIARAVWAPLCVITASTISLRTPANTEVELTLSGTGLDGKYADIGGRTKVHLHRATADR